MPPIPPLYCWAVQVTLNDGSTPSFMITATTLETANVAAMKALPAQFPQGKFKAMAITLVAEVVAT